jgi:hypothetical protein
MLKTYHTVVEFNDDTPPTISKISVPDLGIYISGETLLDMEMEDESKENVTGLMLCPKTTKLIEHAIEERIREIKKAKQIIPEPKFDVSKLKENQILLEINVTVEEVKKGFFARFLPGLGLTLNVGAAVSGVIINVAQMELAMGDSENKKSATALALLQAILSSSVGILFYIYLKSGQGLEKIGIKLDQFLSGQKPAFIKDPYTTVLPISRRMSTGIMLMNLTLGGLVIGLQLGNATSQMGGLNALGEQSSQKDSIISEQVFNIAKWLLISCGGTVGLIMVSMIFNQLSADIQKWCTRPSRSAVESTDTDELQEVKVEDGIKQDASDALTENNGLQEEADPVEEQFEPEPEQLLEDNATRSESMKI